MSVFSITKDNFQSEVMNSDKPVLIDLWAPWCGPCRMMGPVIEDIAAAHPEIKVGKINVDEEPELASSFQVSAIPMLVLVENGKVKSKAVGYKPKADVEAMIR